MTTTAPLYFGHELRVQQSLVDASYMAHCGFSEKKEAPGATSGAKYYECYYASGWHPTPEQAREELKGKLHLAGWSSPE